MSILTQVAKAMQVVLTKTADIIGHETGFIQRQRKFSGSSFIQTLVFGWLDEPEATLEELCQTAAVLDIQISSPGLNKRFTPQASDCLGKVLEEAVSTVIASDPVAIPVLQRFNGVHIQDSSVVTLPDELAVIWSGCGGSAVLLMLRRQSLPRSTTKNTSSSLKMQVRLDLNTGKLAGPYLQSGRENDRSSQLQEVSLPRVRSHAPGALRIADLGYFSLKEFKELDSQGVYWLSRVRGAIVRFSAQRLPLKSNCDLYDEDGKRWERKDSEALSPRLLSFLKRKVWFHQNTAKHCKDKLDMQVLLGAAERVSCRLLVVRVPDKVAKLRRCKLISEAKAKGKKLSKRSLELARGRFRRFIVDNTAQAGQFWHVIYPVKCLIWKRLLC